SGHGDCDIYSRCQCWNNWESADCSERSCPKGLAWSDMPTATDTAHVEAPCSNRGACNRSTGRCRCMPGFSGRACERSLCPRDCSGHGQCLSMHAYADAYRSADSIHYSYTQNWDSDMLYQCACDNGFGGFDCSLRQCPRGDDPLTTGQVNEVQLVVCQATAGFFSLYYEDRVSRPIAFDADADAVAAALEAISVVPDVAVTFSEPASGACNTSLLNVISVEFTQNFGALRPMWTHASALTPGGTDPGVTVTADGSTVYDSDDIGYASVKGTKENAVCSNRGVCDAPTGACRCYDTNGDLYAGSDGYGGPGTRGDCGYAVTETGGCPGEIACSGHGRCDVATFACACDDGWGTGDCSLRQCPFGRSWGGYPSADETAHDSWEECSGAGLCDRETGFCQCGGLFSGGACEYMVCPNGRGSGIAGRVGANGSIGVGTVCNGRGRCVTMAEAALLVTANGDTTDLTYGADTNNAATWDGGRVQHCLCDDGYGGFDCAERLCPTGDDPGTYGQAPETQLLSCAATNGSFTLAFRRAETGQIPFDATAEELEAAIEALSTVGTALVTFNGGVMTFCSPFGADTVAAVSFLTEHGDVPALIVDVSELVNEVDGDGSYGSGNITVATDGASLLGLPSVRGETEEVTCSNRGLCDRATGVCGCFRNWGSSNGYGGIGISGDCGYRVPTTTSLRGA
ncbi:unnamed protein product, partial [Phaeothamnion confervicola]